MKIKTNSTIAFLILSLAVIFTACEKEDKTFTGDAIFAFEASSVNLVINHVEPLYEIPVMMVGAHLAESKSVNFEVLPYFVNVSGDTIRTNIESGVHYVPFTENRVVVAPGESFGYIPLEVNFDNLEKCKNYTLVLELTGGDFNVSSKANNIMIVRFLPHVYFLPENFVGTFNARELSNQPGLIRDYPVILELDSTDVAAREFYFSTSGLWNILYGDSTANAWDRRKIEIMIDDSDPCNTVISADSPQNFFRLSDGTYINWEFRFAGAVDTWENTFNFPSFNLIRDDNGNAFPPNQAAPRGQNVRVELLLNE